MTYILKTDAVSEALDKAVNLKGGDYVYEKLPLDGSGASCRYSTNDGAPSCLVGFVIAEVAPELFAEIVEYEAAYSTSVGVLELVDEFDIEFESADLEYALSYAQEKQDESYTWGEAQAAYYRTVERAAED